MVRLLEHVPDFVQLPYLVVLSVKPVLKHMISYMSTEPADLQFSYHIELIATSHAEVGHPHPYRLVDIHEFTAAIVILPKLAWCNARDIEAEVCMCSSTRPPRTLLCRLAPSSRLLRLCLA